MADTGAETVEPGTSSRTPLNRFDIGQGKLNRKTENPLSNYQNGTGKARI